MNSETDYGPWYFLFIVVILYFLMALFNSNVAFESLNFSVKILMNIIPVFVLVFVIMVLINYFIDPVSVSKHLGDTAGLKKWFIAVVSGIISTGPIYLWYPLLKQLKKKGVSSGLVSTFLYNRAVKPPLIPLMIFYFGLNYTVVLAVVMICVSIIQGLIIEKLEGVGFL